MMLDIPTNVTREDAERLVTAAETRIADLESRFGKDAFNARLAKVRSNGRDDNDPSSYMNQARMFALSARQLFGARSFGEAVYQARQSTLKAIQAEGAARAAFGK